MSARESLSNIDIALFALHKLGGAMRKVHTEHIAWEAYQLAPDRFSWRLPEYRERGFPDKTAVRYALEQAKKKEGGELVSGRGGGDVGGSELEGWGFTPRGVEWMLQRETRISMALQEDTVDLHPRDVNRFLAKIKKEYAYSLYIKDKTLDSVTPYMFTDLLGCTPDASPEIVKKKYDRIIAMTTLVGDSEITEFLDRCKMKFLSLLNE